MERKQLADVLFRDAGLAARERLRDLPDTPCGRRLCADRECPGARPQQHGGAMVPAVDRVAGVARVPVDYCTRARVAVPTEGETTGLVAAARLSRVSAQHEPDAVEWANVNPALAAKPEIAAATEEHSKRIADGEDLKRWEHERMTAFCPDPKINMGVVEVTTGDDKMRASLAFATCTDEKQRHLATKLLDQIVDQCLQTHEWKRNCPRRASVEDQRRRLAVPENAK